MRKRIISMLAALSMVLAMLVPATQALAATPSTDASPTNPGYVYISIDAETLGAGYLYEPVKVPLQPGDTVADITTRLMGQDNYNASMSGGFYLQSVKLPWDIDVNIPQFITDVNGDESGPTQAGDMLGEFDYGYMSGWEFIFNNVLVDAGADGFQPQNGDVINWKYTVVLYGGDLGYASSWNGGQTLFDAANKDDLTRAVADINSAANKASILAQSGVQDAYDNAMAALADLTATQDEVDSALAALNAAVAPEPVTPDNVCSIGDTGYTNLGDALAAAQDGDTITLLANIDYDQPIVVNGKSITFATNGYTLNVTTDAAVALDATNGSINLDDSAGGALNATSTNSSGYGVYAENANSSITATNATAISGGGHAAYAVGGNITLKGDVANPGTAARAESRGTIIAGSVSGTSYVLSAIGTGATITVGGDVVGSGVAAYANNGGTVNVSGNVSSDTGAAVYSTGFSSSVTVGGDVSSSTSYGVEAYAGGSVTVAGNVSGGNYGVYLYVVSNVSTVDIAGNVTGGTYGIYSYSDGSTVSTIHVSGDVTGSTGGVLLPYSGVQVTIDGKVMVPEGAVYTSISGIQLDQSDGVTDSAFPGYLKYTAGFPSYLLVKAQEPQAGAPGSGDLYGTGEVTTQVAMLIAQVVTGGGMDLTPAQFAAVDMDGDGVLTMADVILIMRKANGL